MDTTVAQRFSGQIHLWPPRQACMQQVNAHWHRGSSVFKLSKIIGFEGRGKALHAQMASAQGAVPQWPDAVQKTL